MNQRTSLWLVLSTIYSMMPTTLSIDFDGGNPNIPSRRFNDNSMLCQTNLMICGQRMQKYGDKGFDNISNIITNKGLRSICRDASASSRCALEVSATEVCRGFPAEATEGLVKANNVIEFICLDKINDIEEHMDCLFNTGINEQLQFCQNLDSVLTSCNTEKFMKCAESSFKDNPMCKAGALELTSDILDTLIQVMPTCSGHQQLYQKALRWMTKM